MYEDAATREDVEISNYRTSTPDFAHPSCAMECKYTSLIRYMLIGSCCTVFSVAPALNAYRANMDIDSMSRAAFLCAFAEEVKQGDAHGFFVRYTKFQTVDERRGILEVSRKNRARFRKHYLTEFATTLMRFPAA